MRKIALAIVVAFALPVMAHAQKKALTQADWDKWKSINAPALSNDGKWAVYTLIPQVGDGELVIRSTSGSTEYRVPRGFLGRPNNIPGGLRGPAGGGPEEGEAVGPTATPAQITADSRFVIVSTQATQAEVERAPRGRGAATNRQSLAIVSLPDGKITTLPGVRSFRLARDNGTWLAYVPEPDSASARCDAGRGECGGWWSRRPRRMAVVVAQPAVVASSDRLWSCATWRRAPKSDWPTCSLSRSTTAPKFSRTRSSRATRRRTARSFERWRVVRRPRC